jgi:hypothetical protein
MREVTWRKTEAGFRLFLLLLGGLILREGIAFEEMF